MGQRIGATGRTASLTTRAPHQCSMARDAIRRPCVRTRTRGPDAITRVKPIRGWRLARADLPCAVVPRREDHMERHHAGLLLGQLAAAKYAGEKFPAPTQRVLTRPEQLLADRDWRALEDGYEQLTARE